MQTAHFALTDLHLVPLAALVAGHSGPPPQQPVLMLPLLLGLARAAGQWPCQLAPRGCGVATGA